jgi:long-chain fatty acid transport protein
MLNRSNLGAALALLCALCTASQAHAAGFAIFEQGARGMGFAGAYTAQTQDPSAIFHNAAGIAFLKGKQIYFGSSFIAPKSDFTGDNPYPGAGVTETGDAGVLPVPSVYYAQPFSEKLSFGLGVHTPYGLKTQWKDRETYSGRFVSQLAELKSFSINPTLAYKVRDRFAIGAGLDIRLSTVTLERAVPAIDPFTLQVVDAAKVRLESDTGTGIGFNVGVLGKPSENVSVGLAYRHKVKVDYTGNATFTLKPTGNAQLDGAIASVVPAGAVPITTSIEFPGIASGGVAYTWGEWTFEGDVDWYQWSKFKQIDLAFQGRSDLDETITEDYKNSWQFRLGAERILNDVWAVRGGYFFDQTPAPLESVGPILPDASRNGIALGASWKHGRWRVDAANWILLFNKRSTEGQNRDRYEGTYDSWAEIFALSIGYSF